MIFVYPSRLYSVTVDIVHKLFHNAVGLADEGLKRVALLAFWAVHEHFMTGPGYVERFFAVWTGKSCLFVPFREV